MVRANLRVASLGERPQDVGGPRVGRDRVRDDVGRPDAVAREELVQARERVQVLERLMRARPDVPLVVAFGVDRDEKRRPGRWSGHRG
jgi:hypothetical protein